MDFRISRLCKFQKNNKLRDFRLPKRFSITILTQYEWFYHFKCYITYIYTAIIALAVNELRKFQEVHVFAFRQFYFYGLIIVFISNKQSMATYNIVWNLIQIPYLFSYYRIVLIFIYILIFNIYFINKSVKID